MEKKSKTRIKNPFIPAVISLATAVYFIYKGAEYIIIGHDMKIFGIILTICGVGLVIFTIVGLFLKTARKEDAPQEEAARQEAARQEAARQEAARQAAAPQEAERQAAEAARSTTGKINGHEWVDLGLSVKWATCNVGASSPSEYGNYYAWGETRPKSEYTEDNCFMYGVNMGDISGDVRYDAARANWGGSWRLPTKAEMEELIEKCSWTLASLDGQIGYKVTGPNGSSIFLHAAGLCDDSVLYFAGMFGNYWSSTNSESDVKNAYCFDFDGARHECVLASRDTGMSIRPVSD